MLRLRLKGVVIIVGNYGSGKTEVAVNLAAHQKQLGIKVRLADLDLVNPYFRSREARRILEAMGIAVILPPEELLQADLPILIPQIAGLVREPGDLAILDVGGDDVGATVLAALQQSFGQMSSPVTMIQVVNPFRPNTGTIEGCMNMRRAIEAKARMTVGKWVGNAHMLEETTVEHFRFGIEFMDSLQAASELPVEFVTVPHQLSSAIGSASLKWPVLPIHRQLVPPWLKAAGFEKRIAED